MESTKSIHQTRSILFFDGYCSLCNKWVDLLLRVLKSRKNDSTHSSFHLASLQGKTAQSIFTEAKRTDLIQPPLQTVVLYQRVAGTVGEVEFYTESDAVLKLFSDFEFPWSMIALFRFVPKFIRNFIYRLIAKNRYQWFGKRNQCRLPTPEDRKWLLD